MYLVCMSGADTLAMRAIIVNVGALSTEFSEGALWLIVSQAC